MILSCLVSVANSPFMVFIKFYVLYVQTGEPTMAQPISSRHVTGREAPASRAPCAGPRETATANRAAACVPPEGAPARARARPHTRLAASGDLPRDGHGRPPTRTRAHRCGTGFVQSLAAMWRPPVVPRAAVCTVEGCGSRIMSALHLFCPFHIFFIRAPNCTNDISILTISTSPSQCCSPSWHLMFFVIMPYFIL
jgi:hypothetical protein